MKKATLIGSSLLTISLTLVFFQNFKGIRLPIEASNYKACSDYKDPYHYDYEKSILYKACSVGKVGQYSRDFGLDPLTFNFKRVCDPKSPESKLLETFYLLENSKNPSLSSNSLLNQAYSFSKRNFKRTKVLCKSNRNAAATFTQRGNLVHIYYNLLFGPVTVSRAGTVVHEARHDKKLHNAGNNCPRKASCDRKWTYKGANSYQALYLWEYFLNAKNTTPVMKDFYAKWYAQYIVDSSFRDRPAITIGVTDLADFDFRNPKKQVYQPTPRYYYLQRYGFNTRAFYSITR